MWFISALSQIASWRSLGEVEWDKKKEPWDFFSEIKAVKTNVAEKKPDNTNSTFPAKVTDEISENLDNCQFLEKKCILHILY